MSGSFIRSRLVSTAAVTNIHDMSLPPDQMPPVKPKITPEERRQRDADRLQTIRLRMLVGQALHDRCITSPAAIAAAIGMPVAEAIKLMTGKQWRAGDVALLEAAAARLRLVVPSPGGRGSQASPSSRERAP
ncbi:hypothetical protein [Belnapia sp. F-4-1]|uniref:hypothetical protein n=1 Tax=Belnapia sp. F-4-1 TaxID=1545443 RepID=UPI0005BA7554|nr:hypothetical protein [Belnapia sp. F-4-1]